MAQEVFTPRGPEAFTGLLSKTNIVQGSIKERSERKVTLLEGGRSVRLFDSDNATPPSLNSEINISTPNLLALNESYFLVKLKYTIKNKADDAWGKFVCTTSPAFSWFKNMRVEINGIEVTQSSKVSDFQIVQHLLSMMESDPDRLAYTDKDVYGLQKLDPALGIKDVDLGQYQYGKNRKRGYAFATNASSADAGAPDFAANNTLKRTPTMHLTSETGYGDAVESNGRRVAEGKYQFKMRPFVPFFNADDSWLPPNTQVKIRFDLPQQELTRYVIASSLGAADATRLKEVQIDLEQLDLVYATYRLDPDMTDKITLPRELYYHTWCPRLVQKTISDAQGTIEILQNADIPRRMILFFTDLDLGKTPTGAYGNNAYNCSNRLAMVHGGLTQLRVMVNDEPVFDSPLRFEWVLGAGDGYYDPDKSSYLRALSLVQNFFGKGYRKEVPIDSKDFCNTYFMIPISLNLDKHLDNPKLRGNLSIDYQFTDNQAAPVRAPGSGQNKSLKANLLCLDKYMYTFSKDQGIKYEVV